MGSDVPGLHRAREDPVRPRLGEVEGAEAPSGSFDTTSSESQRRSAASPSATNERPPWTWGTRCARRRIQAARGHVGVRACASGHESRQGRHLLHCALGRCRLPRRRRENLPLASRPGLTAEQQQTLVRSHGRAHPRRMAPAYFATGTASTGDSKAMNRTQDAPPPQVALCGSFAGP